MTTYADLIERARQYLMTGTNERINALDIDCDSSTDTISLRYELKGVAEGSRLSLDLEEMHVLAVSGSAGGSSITVIRGYGGSQAAAHVNGAIIRVSPPFTSWRIAQEVNGELSDLSSPDAGLYQIKPLEFVYNPAVSGYNLTATDMIDIWKVRYDHPGPQRDWPSMRKDEYYVDQDANLSDFAGGKQLVLRRPAAAGFTVRVSYKASFAPLVNLTDDVLAVAGLHNEAHDIPSMGAAIRLMVGKEIKRHLLTQQPEPRRSQEVPSGGTVNSIRALVATYTDRIMHEVTRLNSRYPEQI